MVTCLLCRQVKIKAWRCSTLTWGDPTLPSTLFRFTSEFGMESGGSKTLWSPSKFCLTTAVSGNYLLFSLFLKVKTKDWKAV